jgi:hypothetical protein
MKRGNLLNEKHSIKIEGQPPKWEGQPPNPPIGGLNKKYWF